MKKKISFLIVAILVIGIAITGTGIAFASSMPGPGNGGKNGGNDNSGMIGAVNNTMLYDTVMNMPKQSLSEVEKQGIEYMREEEKLARDVYEYLYGIWGQQTFSNIEKAEVTHMNAVKALIEKYGLKDPAGDEPAGKFSNAHLQDLYDQLTTMGSKSLVDALKVGALIEETDIEDLEKYIANTDNDDIKLVYENLLKGSENHLRAFVRVLKNSGVNYVPQILSQSQYDAIINGTNEHGNGGNNGAIYDKNSVTTLKLIIGKKELVVNDNKKVALDAAPIIKNDRTLVPIRFVVESLGGSVQWDPNERKVTIELGTTKVELWINNPEAKVNGETVWIDPNNHNVKPIIVDPGRTMIPLRFVLESLGANVTWDNTTRTITIIYQP